MNPAGLIEVRGSDAVADLHADGVLTLLAHGVVSGQGVNSQVNLYAAGQLILQPESAVLAGAAFESTGLSGSKALLSRALEFSRGQYDTRTAQESHATASADNGGAAPVAVVTFAGADAALTSNHELIVQGTVTTSDQMTLTAGERAADSSGYFQDLPSGHYLTDTNQFSLLLRGTPTALGDDSFTLGRLEAGRPSTFAHSG
jgi:hypothetical protein